MSRWLERFRPYLMVAPAIIVFVLFFIYPIGYMIYLSFHEWDFISPDKQFVGLDNFAGLSEHPEFLKSLENTFVFTFFSVGITTVLALLLALWINRPTRFYGFVQGAVFSPHIISLVSIAMLWMWLMDPQYGLLNWGLEMFGLPQSQWLASPETALYSIILVAIWKSIGFNTLIIIAGLQSIPPHLYEAAALDQSSRFTSFAKITFPMISPTLFFLIIMNLIGSFQVFETIDIMTQGGPLQSTNTLVYYIYEYGFRFFQLGYASSAGVILLIVLSILTVLYFFLMSKRVHYQ
ncbi:carbohydrate ABC transporter permease [Geomicrobium sp. JCM 19038]|uniref:carbohydrate ABC transporter permease n=1 Tax=Geomicrobium sp. JCM 19038 TaxID=1460635 RepID=UPI00045F3FA0|nr:sugar ABC transporter permease [Geomicrobium sp. JCM 19038]GAK08221.1 glycerol-3-phosphate ABC transporter, permease protein UgpA [Geomicrobium sp. JCM 19038]